MSLFIDGAGVFGAGVADSIFQNGPEYAKRRQRLLTDKQSTLKKVKNAN
jgi:hypothetical protein